MQGNMSLSYCAVVAVASGAVAPCCCDSKALVQSHNATSPRGLSMHLKSIKGLNDNKTRPDSMSRAQGDFGLPDNCGAFPIHTLPFSLPHLLQEQHAVPEHRPSIDCIAAAHMVTMEYYPGQVPQHCTIIAIE